MLYHNNRLLTLCWLCTVSAAAVEIAKEHYPDLEIEILQINHLPFVNTDLEVNQTFPPDVAAFRAKVAAADAVLFASPEYNYSFPGACVRACGIRALLGQ